MFQEVDLLDEDEEDFIKLKEMIEKYPVNAFGIVNKLLNSKGYLAQIGRLR